MMAEITQLVAALGGLSALIVSILYYKQNKKRKQVETKAIEIESLTQLVHELQRDRDSMKKEIDELKNALRVSDSEKISMERENVIYRRSFMSRSLCDRENCPIIEKRDTLIAKK
jgi:uncharacterized protein YlxW (UPF0749 family)